MVASPKARGLKQKIEVAAPIAPATSFGADQQPLERTMKIAYTILLILLTFLAISSGVTKILLMQQDVDFFGQYGFSNLMIMLFGAVQLIGGCLMPFSKSRFAGAVVVAITFLISLVVLLIDGNIPVSIITFAMTLLLGVVMKQSWKVR